MAKVYISTSIPYATGKPHVGNLMDLIYADTLSRYHKMIGDDVLYSAGSDEHGSKIQEKSAQAGITPKQFIDANAQLIIDANAQISNNYTHFIRTDGFKSHKEFVFSAFPYSSCFFCGAAGPETVIEVFASEGISYTSESISIKGKLKLNSTDVNRLMFALHDVKLVK